MTARARWLAAVGKRLAEARERAGMTLDQAGDLIGVTGRVTIWRWEAGKVAPIAYDLARYCRALGVSADAILGLA